MEEKAKSGFRLAYWLLYLGFIAAPIIAGVDKFLYVLGRWNVYLAPQISSILPFSEYTFMKIVGVMEILAGILVWLKPRLGGYVIFFWLLAIIVNILLSGEYYDVALRDVGLALGALALAKLSGSGCRFDHVGEAQTSV